MSVMQYTSTSGISNRANLTIVSYRRPAMAHKTASPHGAKPDMGSLELSEELIRNRAFQLYEERGCENGYDLDDWLRAEAEVMGKKPSESATDYEAAAMSASAA